MRIIILTWIGVMVFTGCVSSPPLPKIESMRGDRIGVFVQIYSGPHFSDNHLRW